MHRKMLKKAKSYSLIIVMELEIWKPEMKSFPNMELKRRIRMKNQVLHHWSYRRKNLWSQSIYKGVHPLTNQKKNRGWSQKTGTKHPKRVRPILNQTRNIFLQAEEVASKEKQKKKKQLKLKRMKNKWNKTTKTMLKIKQCIT